MMPEAAEQGAMSDRDCKTLTIPDAAKAVRAGEMSWAEAVAEIEAGTGERLAIPAIMRQVASGHIDYHDAAALITASRVPEEQKAAEKFCRQADEKELAKTRKALLEASGLDEHQQTKTLYNYEIREEGQREPLMRARAYVKFIDDRKRGLTFYGLPGVGKSHLLQAIVGAVTQREAPRSAGYLDCFAASRKFKKDPGLEERLLKPFLLGIDDIDKVLYGDCEAWVRAMVKRVIDWRVEHRKLIVISTEMSIEEHDRALKQIDPETGVDPTPGRLHWLASRMQTCVQQLVEGPDGRDPKYFESETDPYWAR